jgi:regulator of replication initiation timing
MARTTSPTVDQDPIDRLEEKVRLLVAMIGRLKADQARAADENARLSRELEATRAQLTEVEASTSEVTALRQERETIRGRVTDMLEQLEALHL